MQRIRDNRIFQRFIPSLGLLQLINGDLKREREREEEDRGG